MTKYTEKSILMNFNCMVEVYPAALYIVYNKYHVQCWQDMIYLTFVPSI